MKARKKKKKGDEKRENKSASQPSGGTEGKRRRGGARGNGIVMSDHTKSKKDRGWQPFRVPKKQKIH